MGGGHTGRGYRLPPPRVLVHCSAVVILTFGRRRVNSIGLRFFFESPSHSSSPRIDTTVNVTPNPNRISAKLETRDDPMHSGLISVKA